MKSIYISNAINKIVALALACFMSISVFAQDNSVKIDGQDLTSWLKQNWMWVAGGVVVLLLLIGILSSGSRTRRKTTIVREEGADGIIRTTTTEIKE